MLEVILEFGLILASEPLRLNLLVPTGSGTSPSIETCTVHQRRACFTLASLNDLARRRSIIGEPASHLDLFGRFAIAIRPELGRTLGLLPVHYFYRADTEDGGCELQGLSDLLATYALQIREVLIFLAYSERERKRRNGGTAGLLDLERNYERDALIPELAKKIYRDRILRRIAGAPKDSLDFVHDLLKFDHFHIGHMADSINMLLAAYQTVDSASFDVRFLYYFQQEWRLLSTFNSTALIYELSWHSHPDREVRRLIRDLNERLAGIAMTASYTDWSFGDAMLLHGYSEPLQHFRAAISAIVCPNEVEAEVRRLVEQYRLQDLAILTAP